jgi:hypothetical protein
MEYLLKGYGFEIRSGNYKIHTATETYHPGFDKNPMDAYLNGKFKAWQEYQTRKNFNRRFVLSLIKINDQGYWLFAGIYEIKDLSEKSSKEPKYHSELINTSLNSRLIVFYDKKFRANYLLPENHSDKFHVSSILPEEMSLKEYLELLKT